jgi:hypothetical protein
MNNIEKKMVEVLKTLRDEYAVVQLKAEFEAEASRMNELMRLKEMSNVCDLGLLVKIGGPEDISHMFDALHLGINGLNAPMIETGFAAKKFFKGIKKYVPHEDLERIEISVNIETKTAHQNIDEILAEKESDVLNSITIGRVDLSDSLGLTRAEINNSRICDICEEIYTKARSKNLKCGLGGGISTSAVSFIKKLAEKKLIDRYETRKVVFTNLNDDEEKMINGILKAVEFETLWLQNKKEYYGRIYHEDDIRIEMLNKRLKKEITNSDEICK